MEAPKPVTILLDRDIAERLAERFSHIGDHRSRCQHACLELLRRLDEEDRQQEPQETPAARGA